MYTGIETETRAAIYCRLSKDDLVRDGDSSSIQTQRTKLQQYCDEHGWKVAGIFQDDGYTGLTMDRPGLTQLLEAVERHEIDVLLTKDQSRLSRDYLHAGHLMEVFFPKNGVRYIAVDDNTDTDKENDIAAFRNVIKDTFR